MSVSDGRVQGFKGSRVQGFKFKVQVRVRGQDSGIRVQGSGLGVQG